MSMRTKNSVINILVSCFSYGVIMVGSFVTRQIFANVLGLEIVGIEGAFLNVVSALAIVELGLGVGIVYKLYKPIAQENWNQVAVVLCFLRRCYIAIASCVGVLGIGMAYFVVMPIKEDFSKIWLGQIFILYVIDVVVSYLYSHKRAMFIADQKNYVNNIIHIVAQVLLFVFQILVLKIFASFEGYLICKIFSRLIENLIISYRFDKKYSFIDLRTKQRMPDIEKKDLFKNMKALLLHKISGFGTTTVSSLIIVYCVSLRDNGIYYNYMLIVMALTTVTNEVFNGVIASFGNLLNTSSSKKVYENFNILYFLNFLLYSFIVTSFVCLSTPFINIWTGEGSAFGILTTVAITGYLYIYGMRQSIGMAKVSAGIYDQDKYLAVVGAIVTFVFSWLLVKPLGISGVMIGNIVGIMAIPYWVQPFLVYDEIFKMPVKNYHIKFVYYTVLTAMYAWLSYFLCDIIYKRSNIVNGLSNNLVSNFHISSKISLSVSQVIVNAGICLIIPNIFNIVLFFRTKEFKSLWNYAKSFLRKVKR